MLHSIKSVLFIYYRVIFFKNSKIFKALEIDLFLHTGDKLSLNAAKPIDCNFI